MAGIDDFINYAQGNEFNCYGNIQNVGYVQGYAPYAGQCVSLIQGYMKYFGCRITQNGNAIDWWYNTTILSYFTRVNVSSGFKNGDVIVFNTGNAYGHIGIYYSGSCFQQNYASDPYAHFHPLASSGSPIGILRPKFLDGSGGHIDPGDGGTTTKTKTVFDLKIVGGVIVSATKKTKTYTV